ncbi:tail fiber domain-containing protein [Ferruginibacter lapsinanis]|uniref:tail fiber domain-containing protein n=1 Tax=Ferruginibacter lapsinanis TaxID=563172 RepID=UPI001E4F2432|nr:tail fiber domain-containing protein [Ferruginibacter lapsinanis]UEG50474.1 tail fiber domain-containing protein [Ferruginibacter lapsinanis]
MKPIHIKYVRALLFSVVISLSGSTASSQSTTDKDIKKNITPIENATASLIQLEPQKFEYNVNAYKQLNLPKGVQYGFLTENVLHILPELVTKKNVRYSYGKNDTRNALISTIDNNNLTPFLVASIKELHEEIQRLKELIETMKKS